MDNPFRKDGQNNFRAVRKTMDNMYSKEKNAGKQFADFASYSGLNHGQNFVQQNLHWLIHQADRAREVYGRDSVEYESLIARIANQIHAYARGGNFTLEELKHYDSMHTAAMSDASNMLVSTIGVPLMNYINGYNWTNVVVCLGNADGSGYTEHAGRASGTLQPARVGAHPTPQTPDKPRIPIPLVRPSAGKNPQNKTIQGVEIYTQHLASKADTRKK